MSLFDLTRRSLFLLSAEQAHDLTIASLSRCPGLAAVYGKAPVGRERHVMGIQFRNGIGLAAGLDKNAACLAAWEKIGFGFVEVGTVTPRPQPGNPKPRMFRIEQSGAIINRLGFNSQGLDAVVANLERGGFNGVVGVNIGKNATTPVERALDDYLTGLRAVYPYADYITLNISSPNTEGLRTLQFGEALDHLLAGVVGERDQLAKNEGRRVPLVLKISPDLEPDAIAAIADSVLKCGVDGVIATNTTVARPDLTPALPDQAGGLSGAPLRHQACSVLTDLRAALGAEFPLIGAGGIMCADDAVERVNAGADLLQIYTGFIYRGPALLHDAINAIDRD